MFLTCCALPQPPWLDLPSGAEGLTKRRSSGAERTRLAAVAESPVAVSLLCDYPGDPKPAGVAGSIPARVHGLARFADASRSRCSHEKRRHRLALEATLASPKPGDCARPKESSLATSPLLLFSRGELSKVARCPAQEPHPALAPVLAFTSTRRGRLAPAPSVCLHRKKRCADWFWRSAERSLSADPNNDNLQRPL